MDTIQTDVVIVGGGVTGVVAALAARRAGARTILLESRTFVGGNATTGLCLHSFLTRDRRQVVYGIAQEIVDRLQALGGAVGHIPYDGFVSAVTPVDGDIFRITVTEMLAEAGVQIIYGCNVVGVDANDGFVNHLDVAMKGGIRRIEARSFIDSTGDGDVAAYAGATVRTGDSTTGKMQPVSMLMRFFNVDTRRIANEIGEVNPAMATKNGGEPFPVYFNGTFSKWNDVIREERIFPNEDHKVFFNTTWPNQINVNTSAVFNVDGTDPLALSKATVELTQQVRKAGDFLVKHVPGFEGGYYIPAIFAGVRETRNVLGQYEIQDEDVLSGRKFEDTIGEICFPVDIHDPDTGQATFHDIGGDGAFDVPYRSLVPKGFSNLLVAGRCISATSFAHGATRNMAPCMVTGQAAGVAAARSVRTNAPTGKIDVAGLQEELREGGAYLGQLAA
ncbi:hypothetical protein FP2506_17499 [Fulvimarina pelagi HTCC2506]|uniref:FAD dependent oxidoreductase n=2 Tax=Fulvimarina pelagi TaxID=217511 RepID=Q0FY48_9HYPH|nr:hypothetical protein FP2506_17499 [Fulvimarina pelagi HTCC2506]